MPCNILTDYQSAEARMDRRTPRASAFRKMLTELKRAEAQAQFLALALVIVVTILGYTLVNTREELVDLRAEYTATTVVLAAKNVAEREWECRDVKAFKGTVRTCIRTTSQQ